jgi:hypothetical protein
MLLFGLIGLMLIGLGLAGGAYVVYLWQTATLNPDRPLMTLLVLFILTGIQILMFGFLGSGLVRLRKEIFVVQRENKLLEMKLDEWHKQLRQAANEDNDQTPDNSANTGAGRRRATDQTPAVDHKSPAGISD